MSILPILADVSLKSGRGIGGDGLVHQLLMILVVGICVGIVYAMGWWFLKRPPIPAIALTVWNGLFILVGGIIIINFLLSLGGHQFIEW